MNGAREYAEMFNSGQRGRLYLECGYHERGKTFRIWVLPTADPIACKPWDMKDAVEVYGITGGQPGWTETYGWLHRGKWEQDFALLVEVRRAEIASAIARREQEKVNAEEAERQRQAALLASYSMIDDQKPEGVENAAKDWNSQVSLTPEPVCNPAVEKALDRFYGFGPSKSALKNCRLFAARHRSEGWAKTILKFCAEGDTHPTAPGGTT